MLSLLSSAFLFIAFTSALVLTPVASDTIAQPANLASSLGSLTRPWKSVNSTDTATAILGSNPILLTYPGDLVYSCNGPYGGYNLNLQSCLEVIRFLVVVPHPFLEMTWANREFAQGLPLPQRYMSCKYPSPGRLRDASDRYSCKPTEPASSSHSFFRDKETQPVRAYIISQLGRR